MPTIHREAGFRFGFKMGDGKVRRNNKIVERPHVDAIGHNGDVKVWLDTLEIAEMHGLSDHDVAVAIKIIDQHRTAMIEAWQEVFGE